MTSMIVVTNDEALTAATRHEHRDAITIPAATWADITALQDTDTPLLRNT